MPRRRGPSALRLRRDPGPRVLDARIDLTFAHGASARLVNAGACPGVARRHPGDGGARGRRARSRAPTERGCGLPPFSATPGSRRPSSGSATGIGAADHRLNPATKDFLFVADFELDPPRPSRVPSNVDDGDNAVRADCTATARSTRSSSTPAVRPARCTAVRVGATPPGCLDMHTAPGFRPVASRRIGGTRCAARGPVERAADGLAAGPGRIRDAHPGRPDSRPGHAGAGPILDLTRRAQVPLLSVGGKLDDHGDLVTRESWIRSTGRVDDVVAQASADQLAARSLAGHSSAQPGDHLGARGARPAGGRATSSLERRTPEPITVPRSSGRPRRPRAASPREADRGDAAVLHPRLLDGALHGRNEHLRTSRVRLTRLLTSARVSARTTHAATRSSPSRRPMTTTQFAPHSIGTS